MRTPLQSRKQYMFQMRERYLKARSRQEKSDIFDEVVQVTGSHRKHAIKVLNRKTPFFRPKTT